jgi:hypothetical protein
MYEVLVGEETGDKHHTSITLLLATTALNYFMQAEFARAPQPGSGKRDGLSDAA